MDKTYCNEENFRKLTGYVLDMSFAIEKLQNKLAYVEECFPQVKQMVNNPKKSISHPKFERG